MRHKARYIYDKFGLNCFADDTGLEVEALEADPVYGRLVMLVRLVVRRTTYGKC